MITQDFFTIGITLALGASLFLVYASYRKVIAEGKRPFGFYCDTCTGKYHKNGKPYIRCMFKPLLLKACGVDITQTKIPRQEPGSILDD